MATIFVVADNEALREAVVSYLELSARRQDGSRAIEVADNGEGIREQDIGRVFDRLYRGERARSSPGSGLGLTIARRIAELHGGSLHIKSVVGEGTTIVMLLPQSGL